MRKLWDVIKKFSQKNRTPKPLPVLMHNDVIIDEPMTVANHFGSFFANMSSRLNYPQAFFDHERELVENLPDFDIENREDYIKKKYSEGINRCHQPVRLVVDRTGSDTLSFFAT